MERIFTADQSEFIKNELGIDVESVPVSDKSRWNDIREKCFDIEVDEACEADEAEEAGEADKEISKRGETAADIVDVIMSNILKAA